MSVRVVVAANATVLLLLMSQIFLLPLPLLLVMLFVALVADDVYFVVLCVWLCVYAHTREREGERGM